MSAIYWRNLTKVPSEDSELLKDYQTLSQKINEYYQDHDFISELPLYSISLDDHQKTPTKTRKKNSSTRNSSAKTTPS